MQKLSKPAIAAALSVAFGLTAAPAFALQPGQYEVAGCTSDGKTAHAILWFEDEMPRDNGQALADSTFGGVVSKFTADQVATLDASFTQDLTAALDTNDMVGAPASMSDYHKNEAGPDITEGCAINAPAP